MAVYSNFSDKSMPVQQSPCCPLNRGATSGVRYCQGLAMGSETLPALAPIKKCLEICGFIYDLCFHPNLMTLITGEHSYNVITTVHFEKNHLCCLVLYQGTKKYWPWGCQELTLSVFFGFVSCHCYYFTQTEMQSHQQIKIMKSLEIIMLKYLVIS